MEAPDHRTLIPWCLAAALLVAAVPGHAADPVAESLFRAALAKMEAGEFDDACPLLEASKKRESKSGTVLLLASCYEETGQLARGWATYLEAASRARAERRPTVAKRAQDLAEALRPRLGHVVVRAPERPSRFAVTIDGTEIPLEWGLPVPIDPGEHRVVADAPGWLAWSTTVTVAEGDTIELTVPKLEPAPVVGLSPPLARATAFPSLPAPMPSQPAASDDGFWTTGFWVAVGVGGALAVTGLAFAIDQQVVAAELDDRCGGEARDACPTTYDFAGARAREERGQALAIGFGATGLAGLATAAILHQLAPDSAEETALVPLVGPNHAGLLLRW